MENIPAEPHPYQKVSLYQAVYTECVEGHDLSFYERKAVKGVGQKKVSHGSFYVCKRK